MMKRRDFLVGLALALAPAVAARAQQPTEPLVRVTGIEVQGLRLDGNRLLADVTTTLDIVGREVELNQTIPVTLGNGGPSASGSCDILTLSVGPLHLDLLGLVVNLDDCDGGPVVVSVTGDDSGLLGQLLCGLAGDLGLGLDLGQILSGLSGEELSTLLSGLTDLLNQLFDEVLSAAGPGPSSNPPGTCPILSLHIPDGLHLTLLGLNVDTSPICLDVYAQPGPGNLLGNLLCSLTNLLNNNGNNSQAELVLVRNILRILDRLGL